MLQTESIQCPFCGQTFELEIDLSAGTRNKKAGVTHLLYEKAARADSRAAHASPVKLHASEPGASVRSVKEPGGNRDPILLRWCELPICWAPMNEAVRPLVWLVLISSGINPTHLMP
jgi:hypothetical protein